MALRIDKEPGILIGLAAAGLTAWLTAKWLVTTTSLDPGWLSVVERLGRSVGWVSFSTALVIASMSSRVGFSGSRPHTTMLWKSAAWAILGGSCLLVPMLSPGLLPTSALLLVYATSLLGVIVTGAAAWALRHFRH